MSWQKQMAVFTTITMLFVLSVDSAIAQSLFGGNNCSDINIAPANAKDRPAVEKFVNVYHTYALSSGVRCIAGIIGYI